MSIAREEFNERKSGYEIIAEVASMTTAQIRHEFEMENKVKEAEENAYYEHKKSIHKLIENIPELINFIEEYVKCRIYINDKKTYYKKKWRFLEPSEAYKKEYTQTILIEFIEKFIKSSL